MKRWTQSASNFRRRQIVANQILTAANTRAKKPGPQIHPRLHTYHMQPHVVYIMCAAHDHVSSTTSTAPASIGINVRTILRWRCSHHLPYHSTLRSNTFSIPSLRFRLLPKGPKEPKGVNMKYLNGAAGAVSKHPTPILRVFLHYASETQGS